MSRSAVVYQSVDPKAMASRRAANHFLVQQMCWDRYLRLHAHLADDFVAPSTVQRHRMATTRKRVMDAAAKKTKVSA